MRKLNGFFFTWFFKPKPVHPILVEGLPGIGLVGKISADYLINTYDAEKFLEIHSQHFVEPGYVDESSGVSKLPVNELFLLKGEKIGIDRDFFVLTGDCQPSIRDTYGHFVLSYTLVKLLSDFSGDLVITLGGLQTQSITIPPLVYVSTSDSSVFSLFNFKKANCLVSNFGRIYGAAGLLLAFAKIFDLKGVSLLGTTPGNLPDYYAAYTVLVSFSKLFNLSLDFSTIQEMTEKTKKILTSFREEFRKKKEEKKPKGTGYM